MSELIQDINLNINCHYKYKYLNELIEQNYRHTRKLRKRLP